MSTQETPTERAARLRNEIAERQSQLGQIEKPMTRDELVQLARTEPAKFNKLFEAGLAADAFAPEVPDGD